MDSHQHPPEALLKVARETLGVSQAFPANNISKAYLDELKTHLMLYPDDTNFRVTLQPGQGLGKVTCLEKGCGMIEIPLVTRVKVSDGGKRDGLGSLSAYRHHISGHPTHEANRHARVKAQKNGNPTASPSLSLSSSLSVKIESKGSLLQRLDASSPFGSPRPATPVASTSKPNPRLSLGSTPASRRVSSLVRIPVKPEPIDSSIPLKRTSDVFSPNVKDEETFNPFGSAKKAKLDTPKKPLSQLNRNTDSAAAGPSNSTAIEDTRTRIRDLQVRISDKTDVIDRIRRKKKKTKADLTRMDNLSRELIQLKKLKDEYNATIPSMSPIKRTLSRMPAIAAPKAEPPALTVAQIMNDRRPATQPIASGSRFPGHFILDDEFDDDDDSDMDVDMNNPVLQRVLNNIPAIAPLPGAENYDSNGDYHGRGRDIFRGPQAKADDIDKFLLDAGNAEAFDGNASIDKALEVLGLKAQYELLPGMEIALMPHQTIGVAWMLEKERSNSKGGCLADDMGLGKTVQMIATMVKNQSTDPMCKTNLIIAPTALLDQWKMEIEVKTNNGFKCLIYHGSSKPRRKQDILKYDIVLTTYTTMALEWPDFEMEQKKKEKARRKKQPVDDFIEADSDSELKGKSKKKKARDVGLLFQIDFFRIILDEAQAIRNKRTRWSRSVTELRSVYRWCLTGTPIVNGLLDAYGYFRFLKVRPWYDFTEFQGHIGSLEKKQPEVAVVRLQAIFASILLRRMKDTELDGKRLIELPPKEVSLRKLQFSQEERDVYQMVEARTQATFNRYLRAGTVLKNYSQVLVLLLRLRQVCSHPCLIQEDGGAFIAADEFDDESAKPENREELSRARRLLGPDFVVKVKENFKKAALARMAAEKESVDATIEDLECPICFDVFTDAVVTPCVHVFCRECIVNVLNLPRGEDGNEPTQYKADERPCPSCRSSICVEKLFKGEAFEPTAKDLLSDEERAMMEDSDDPDMNDIFSNSKAKGKGKAKAKKPRAKRAVRRRILASDDIIGSEDESEDDNDDDDMSDFIVESDEDEEEKDAARKLKKRLGKKRAIILSDDEAEAEDEIEDSPEEKEIIFGERKKLPKEQIKLMPRFLPSTKMKYMMEHLRKLAVERPDEKTLIVSQWTTCLQLVSDYLTEAGVLHVKYQGDMTRSKRDQAVRVFMSKDKARVMLMSLKCGGVGLNLTRANNVISLDLGWSQAIEAQSFDRVHRLGQLRPVEVQRLVISDTVEDRVLAMQERKQNLADGSLGEGSGKKIGKMSVKELASLFGLDHRGRLLAGA